MKVSRHGLSASIMDFPSASKAGNTSWHAGLRDTQQDTAVTSRRRDKNRRQSLCNRTAVIGWLTDSQEDSSYEERFARQPYSGSDVSLF